MNLPNSNTEYLLGSYYDDNQPENSFNATLRPPSEDDDTDVSTSALMMSSVFNTKLKDIDKPERERWGTFKYACFVVPTIWGVILSIFQVVIASLNSQTEGYGNVVVFNFVSGGVSLVLSSIYIMEKYIYIVPISWISDERFEAHKKLIDNWCISFLLFIITSLLDVFLIIWNMIGFAFSYDLYTKDFAFSNVFFIFSIANLILNWSKYSILLFVLKFSARSGFKYFV